MATQVVGSTWNAVGFEVTAVRMKPERDCADFPGHEPGLRGPHVADGKIDVSAQKVSNLIGDDQLERKPWVLGTQAGQHRRQYLHTDHLAGAEPHRTANLLRSPGRDAYKRAGGSCHGLCIRGELYGRIGWLQTVLRAGEQHCVECPLQFVNVAADGRLR